MNDNDLLELYKDLMILQKNGVFSEINAIELIAVCAELGDRGYTLTEDESH